MNEFTDDDIPICCGECSPDVYLEGLGAMIAHLLKYHKQYTVQEAMDYANKWLQDAYQRIDEEGMEYAAQMRRRYHL